MNQISQPMSAALTAFPLDQWYVAGANAEKEVLKKKLKLPMLAGKTVKFYNDDKNREIYSKDLKINKNGELEIEIQPNGGFVLK